MTGDLRPAEGRRIERATLQRDRIYLVLSDDLLLDISVSTHGHLKTQITKPDLRDLKHPATKRRKT